MKTNKIVYAFFIAALLLVSQNLWAHKLSNRADYPHITLTDLQVINKFEKFHNRAEKWKNLNVITAIDSINPTFGNYTWAKPNEIVWGRGYIDVFISNINSDVEFVEKQNVKYRDQYKNWFLKVDSGWPYYEHYWYSSCHPLNRVAAQYTSAYSLVNYYYNNETFDSLYMGAASYLQRQQENTGMHKGEFKYWLKRYSKKDPDTPANEAKILNPRWNAIPTTFSIRAFYDVYFACIKRNHTEVAKSLLNNIKLGAESIIKEYENINCPNGVANQIYAICAAYRATGDFNYLNCAIINAERLLNTLDLDGNFTIGNGCGKATTSEKTYTVYHDSFVQYQALSLRALIEVYSLIDNKHPLKPKIQYAIIKCINHILEKRLGKYDDVDKVGKFKYCYKDINGVEIESSYIGSEYTLQALIMAEKYLDLDSTDKQILKNVTATVFMKMEENDVSIDNKTYISALFLINHFGKNFDFKVNNVNTSLY